jgi:aspartyl-tRNA(Asn)/glutamyl-tRNA(Gln) amidotransferase subunit A
MTNIADLSTAELTESYRRGLLSPVEVVRDALARIEHHAALNAFILVDSEGALTAAAQSEARWRAGAPLGAADGLPATIKDNIPVKGLPNRRGAGPR